MTIVQTETRYADSSKQPLNWTTSGYWEISKEINRRYAEKWGYEYHAITFAKKEGELAYVTRLGPILRFLENNASTDWVLVLDSDAHVSKLDWDLPRVLDAFNVSVNTHMVMENEATPEAFETARDHGFAKMCPEKNLTRDTVPNAGVYLLRNSDIGRKIYSTWNSARTKYPLLLNRWPGDQGMFHCELSTHEELAQYIQMLRGERFVSLYPVWRDGWIQHYTGGRQPARQQNFSMFLAKMMEETERF